MFEFLGKFLVNLKIVGIAIAQNTQNPPNNTQNPGGASFTLSNPLACTDLTCIANAITSALFKVATPIVAIMVLIGGFQILTAGGDPEKFKTGRKTILYSVVGYAIIILANGVVSIIQSLLGG